VPGHAALTAALARALAIPIRVVNGVVYSGQHGGFLYHTWNEAWIEGRGWQAIDPTLGQLSADATHVKLIEGESLAQLVPLVGMVGKARIESARALARW
jgi:transglutaminase-like putative cysteine protease